MAVKKGVHKKKKGSYVKITKADVELLGELCNAYGVSGNEGDVRKIIMREMKGLGYKKHLDTMGNLIYTKKGSKPSVMLAAHMDEIGLMIKNITERGSILFSALGGIDPLALMGQQVKIMSSKGLINGIITTPEMSDGEDLDEFPDLSYLIVDTGLTKKELKEIDVKPGRYISLSQPFIQLGSDNIVSGKALDNRIGCFILLKLAKALKKDNNEINFVFTVQEEVGLLGARVSSYRISPDWGLAIDVTTDNSHDEDPSVFINKGPTIIIKDAELISNRCLVKEIQKVAERNNIPYQAEVSDHGTTDATSISLTRHGIPAAVVGVAIRNIHTTVGIASMTDILLAIELVRIAILEDIPYCFDE